MRTDQRPQHNPADGVIGFGYQGHTLDTFIDGLGTAGVRLLVDVRLTPTSRKPGFARTRLQAALRAAGIDYLHLSTLGNPKANRAGFAGPPAARATAAAVSRHRPTTPAAAAAI